MADFVKTENGYEYIDNIIPDSSDKMDIVNPTGTGSFSLNRSAGSTVGEHSFAEGYATTASGQYSHAEGNLTTASDYCAHAEGFNTKATNSDDHAEGAHTKASGGMSHAEGSYTTASGSYSHAEGFITTASGQSAHAEGNNTKASGDMSHAEGSNTSAKSSNQHVQGKYNIEDANGTYQFIIGNGTNNSNRHNCFMIDWNGAIYVQSSDNANQMMKITVSSDGTITATAV